MKYRLPALILLVSGSVLGGCASRANRVAGDPLEPMNRVLFNFNTALDKTVLIPVSKTYQAVTPKPARNGIRNFLGNLSSPIILVNDVLQGEWKRAGVTIGRFAINTTAGVGGLFDVAKRNGLERHNEDFGQTMAVAGIGAGPYLVLPLLGPSSLRDAFGRLPDHFFAPLTYTQFDGKKTYLTTSRAVDIIDKRARALKLVKKLRKESFDEYNSARDLYWQTRKDDIANGHTEIESLPEFDISSTE